jgi:16S rRNA (guanine527-N7)-methyltransferase
MDTARIAALLEPFLDQPLSPLQLDQISIYIDLLQRWNARINLTAIRHQDEIVTRHFGESLFLARHLFSDFSQLRHLERPCHPDPELAEGEGPAFSQAAHPPRVLDIGSGSGFPALPLKIYAPNIHLTLIESNHKKAAFLNEVARALTFTNINVIAERAEEVAKRQSHQADVVTLRAVERFEAILPQAVALLAPNGTLAVLITTAQLPQLAILSSLTWQPEIYVPQSQTRVLSIGYIS